MARLSRELVNQALHLARREPKRPKEASLRRAISASYYALFHFLIEEATRRIIGGSPHVAPLRELASRAFVHGKMKTLCSEFLRPNHRLLRALPAPFSIVPNPDLHTVCRAFVDLQEKRHTADYDLTASFSRTQALQAANQADAAMQCWGRVATADPDLVQTFAVCLCFWPTLAGH